MDNFFLSNAQHNCDYAVVRLNKNKKYKQKVLKKSFQSYNLSDKDYISLEEIIKQSGSNLCKNIEKDYILDTVKKSDIVILSLSITDRKTRSKISAKKLCGLILLKCKTTNLYINLICGLPGLGKKLLNIVEKVAKSYNLNKIKLDSVDNAIGFYIKNNFTFDRGTEVYELGEDDEDLTPKKISKIPPKYLNNKLLDIGYLHKETRGNKKYTWCLVEENGLRRWKFVKPSFLHLNKFSSEIRNKILTRKPNLISKKDLIVKGRSKKLKNNGIISTLRNVNLVNYDYNYTIKMTKKL